MTDLSQEWKAWINLNLSRGCNAVDMARQMQRDGGFSNPLPLIRFYPADLAHSLAPKFESNQITLNGHTARLGLYLKNPLVCVLNDFLKPAEVAALVAAAESRLEQNRVVDPESGQQVEHTARTSHGTFFTRSVNEIVQTIENRVALLTGQSVEQFEGVQVMRYTQGQEYKAHHDYFNPKEPGAQKHLARGGQRILTALMYLSNPESGGATTFPDLGLSVVPQLGTLCLFANVRPDGIEEPLSLHAAEPVQQGVKWISTIWIRQGAYS